MTGAPPKVFISYSHDTVEHQDRVLGFALRLRADGIDAEVDQYNTSPPEGWPLWCERQIEALQDDDKNVRRAVDQALRNLGSEPPPPDHKRRIA
jgi:hypothetical protein